MVVDEEGRFLTQRELPRMALVDTALDGVHLILSDPNGTRLKVPLAEEGARLLSVAVWKSTGLQAEDCGERAAAWLSAFLGVRCRLVRIGNAFRRPILKPGRAGAGDSVNFADSFPFLLVSEASLGDLNRRLAAKGESSVPMDRFRPNLVVAGCEAYAEDDWTRLRIGEIVFRMGGPCARCAITTTDQRTGAVGKEPLRTLATYRRDPIEPNQVNFAQNVLHETKSGTLRIGDQVELI